MFSSGEALSVALSMATCNEPKGRVFTKIKTIALGDGQRYSKGETWIDLGLSEAQSNCNHEKKC